jgi:hypothetical protein
MVSCETPFSFLQKVGGMSQIAILMDHGSVLYIQELSHHKTGRTSTDQKGVRPGFRSDLL